jgi:uncharacterized membrane protein YccC
VIAPLFAIAFKVVASLQMALFVGFGGFATLVLASFGGTRRDKLIAHAGLAVAGSVLLTIGTLVSFSVAVAAIVTVPIAFLVFFAGVIGPNAASGVFAALLAYVLPAASVGTIGTIPDRLAGWWLASVAGTIAVLMLSPRSEGDQLRPAVAKLTGALADELDAVLAGQPTEDLHEATFAAKDQLLTRFTATPFRPTGLASAEQAVANAVDLLEWCTSLVADLVRERGDLLEAAPLDRELLAAAAVALQDAGGLLTGGDARPDLEHLEDLRTQSIERLQRLSTEREDYEEQARVAFHANSVALAVLAIGADALVAVRMVDAEWINEARTRWFMPGSTRVPDGVRGLGVASRVASRHVTVRSVWLINSLRGAFALAAAVAVADLTSVQHGFWVVLGALSVLRTSATSTGATALRALAGTLAGFVIGGALVLAIGSDSTALWVAFPIALMVAAYAPGTAPFAVGQAAFTVFLVVLFNLLDPVGWKVGVVRVEDVAIGCAVSLAVGVLFWPRGLAAIVGDDLADAYRSGASYLRQALDRICQARAPDPDAARAAVAAAIRLDHALRAFLAEQGTKHVSRADMWRLVGGSQRLRLTAHAVAQLPHEGNTGGAARAALAQRAASLNAFYQQLASLLGRPRGGANPTLTAPSVDDHATNASRSRDLVWLTEYLDHLTEHLAELVDPANRIAQLRRRPWWR